MFIFSHVFVSCFQKHLADLCCRQLSPSLSVDDDGLAKGELVSSGRGRIGQLYWDVYPCVNIIEIEYNMYIIYICIYLYIYVYICIYVYRNTYIYMDR